MKIYNVWNDNTIERSFTDESAAISFAADTKSVIQSELYMQYEKSVGSVHDLAGIGKGLTVALYGAGPSNAVLKCPAVDVVMAANARWAIPNLDYNLYIDERYANWLKAGKIVLPPNVQHIAQEGNSPADFWFAFNRTMCGHSGKTLLYVADKICRFEKIYLLGYDYTLSPDRKLHGNEPDGLSNDADCREHEERIFECMLQQYQGINWTYNRIVNLNPLSALKIFQKA